MPFLNRGLTHIVRAYCGKLMPRVDDFWLADLDVSSSPTNAIHNRGKAASMLSQTVTILSLLHAIIFLCLGVRMYPLDKAHKILAVCIVG